MSGLLELKPKDNSEYCKPIFNICNKTLIMSATILKKDFFCNLVGLNPNEVKFIEVPSTFPVSIRLFSRLMWTFSILIV